MFKVQACKAFLTQEEPIETNRENGNNSTNEKCIHQIFLISLQKEKRKKINVILCIVSGI